MPGDAETGGGLYLAPSLYDVINAPGTAAEVDALERVAARFGPPAPGRRERRWLEPACGTGRYLRGLRRRGHDVAGYDPLPGMLAYAERRLARWPDRWRLHRASFTTPAADLGADAPFDVAFCPVNSLRHLPDDDALAAHLAQVGALLAPGGIYVAGLDLHHAHAGIDEDVWESVRGGLRVTAVVQYLPPEGTGRREQVIVETTAVRPGGTEHHGWTYRLRTYTPGQWEGALARAGWRRLATCDARGRPVEAPGRLPYQLDVLVRA